MLALFPVPGFWPRGEGGYVLCVPQVKRKNITNGLLEIDAMQ